MGTELVIVCLFLFGICYDQLVAYINSYTDAYVPFFVVGGVLVTLLASIPLIGLDNFLLVIALFAASGLPMVAGSVLRFIRKGALKKYESEARRIHLERVTQRGDCLQ